MTFTTYTPGGRVVEGSIAAVMLDDETTYQCRINDAGICDLVTRQIELRVVGESA